MKNIPEDWNEQRRLYGFPERPPQMFILAELPVIATLGNHMFSG